jgi:hypothetical protein
MQWVPRALSLELKRQWREITHQSYTLTQQCETFDLQSSEMLQTKTDRSKKTDGTKQNHRDNSDK